MAVAGCGGPPDLMPLRENAKWTYRVNNGYRMSVQSMRVTGQASVGNVQGWDIEGPNGVSRLAWDGGSLVAERFVNIRFVPPIPILTADDKKLSKHWKGRVETPAGYYDAEADIDQNTESIKIATHSYKAVKSRVKLFLPGKRTEVVSWFAAGSGLLRQEQRTDDKLDVSLEMLNPER